MSILSQQYTPLSIMLLQDVVLIKIQPPPHTPTQIKIDLTNSASWQSQNLF